ncbi:hypothetical protein B0H11DRAFT_2186832 [Mycena galericulata]|nr:hypothetical protein B0H11DRAFT_2186832 [Mycena galericulata]
MSGRQRNSLLVHAGDAIAHIRFGRRRQSIRQPPEPAPIQLALPHVIDISAPPPDEELEERQRLRDAAAQSIGLGLLRDEEEAQEVVVEEEEEDPLPPFPASPALLGPFTTLAASLPKYYPPTSLRIFALAKQWKTRHILLSPGTPSHLHLFKGPANDNQELERLAIGPDSVVFVAESTPLDRALVIKVGGADVGARRREWNPTDDNGRTVWLLHFPSPPEGQRWISAIKSAIFDQKSQRAGLAPLPPTSIVQQEPRGDMDVMLSMRIHAASASSPPQPAPNHESPRPPTSPTASLAPSSTRSVSMSVRSAATAPAPKTHHAPAPSVSAVAALKGLFSAGNSMNPGRPRSASAASVTSARSLGVASARSVSPSTRSISISSARPGLTRALSASGHDSASDRGSFARMGSLLAGAAGPRPKVTLPVGPPNGGLERRIVRQGERELAQTNGEVHTNGEAHTNGEVHTTEPATNAKRRTLGALSLTSLQPPPRSRKRWTAGSAPPGALLSVNGHADGLSEGDEAEDADVVGNGYPNGSPTTTTGSFFYAHPHANGSSGTAGSFGVPPSVVRVVRSGDDAPDGCAPPTDHGSLRSGSTRSRASSVGTAGTTGNNNNNPSAGSARRWSTLPRRLTPPASPPPAAPTASRTIPHPYAAAPEPQQRTPSRASGRSFGSTGRAELSASGSGSGAQATQGKAGWGRGGKRASGMSVGSVSIGGTSVASASSGSGTGARARVSVPPPPRPAPTGALPPAPADGGSPNGRASFRESVSAPPPAASTASLPAPSSGNKSFRESMSLTHRALRLSLMAPKPPPAGVLPPRPDEQPPVQFHAQLQQMQQALDSTHPRRSSSGGASNGRASATSMNGAGAGPAFPPPRGPLPPTPPAAPTQPASAPEPPPARHGSLKLRQRLRILSAPPAPHPASLSPPQDSSVARRTSVDGGTSGAPAARLMTLASFLSVSTPTTPTTAAPPASFAAALAGLAPLGPTPPTTPLGEKIIQFHTQNDPSFLQMSAASTPVLRPLPALPVDPPAPAPAQEYGEMVSLLPPPRRGSRQISIKEAPERTPTPEPEPPRDQAAENAGPGPGKLFSLSRHGSVISLGIVTV